MEAVYKMKILTFLLLLPITLLSCGSDDTPNLAPAPDPMPSILNILISTSDNVGISTRIKKPAEFASPATTIIFIHGVGADGKSEWTNSSLYNKLFEEGYIVVAYDIRTYGQSDSDGNRANLLTDPDRAPLDLYAVLEYLQNDADIDNSRIE